MLAPLTCPNVATLRHGVCWETHSTAEYLLIRLRTAAESLASCEVNLLCCDGEGQAMMRAATGVHRARAQGLDTLGQPPPLLNAKSQATYDTRSPATWTYATDTESSEDTQSSEDDEECELCGYLEEEARRQHEPGCQRSACHARICSPFLSAGPGPRNV